MSEVLTQGPLFLASLIFMLGIVVVVHELGHYLAGRYYGAAAESFSVGFGKPIWETRDKRGTRWRINWIPLGGFVKFVGEPQAPGDVGRLEQGPIGKPFMALGPGARSVISVAGPLANFIFAALVFGLILWANGSPRERIVVDSVQPGMPGAEAGLQPGDAVVSIDGKTLENRTDFLMRVQLGAGDRIPLQVERDGETLPLVIQPERQVRDNGVGMQVSMGVVGIGLSIDPQAPKRYGPIEALGGGIVETGDTIALTGNMIARMVTGREPLSSLSGPIGIGDVTRRVVNRTMAAEQVSLADRLTALFWTAMRICALVSVGIGLFNLLPLPVLDGGHIVFNAYEAVTGKALPEKIQEGALTAGLILLIGLFFVVTWGDIIETGVFTPSGNP